LELKEIDKNRGLGEVLNGFFEGQKATLSLSLPVV
jgi:hypothetical protein